MGENAITCGKIKLDSVCQLRVKIVRDFLPKLWTSANQIGETEIEEFYLKIWS